MQSRHGRKEHRRPFPTRPDPCRTKKRVADNSLQRYVAASESEHLPTPVLVHLRQHRPPIDITLDLKMPRSKAEQVTEAAKICDAGLSYGKC